MHSIVLLKGIYLSVSTLEHILIKMHIPLHPWFSLEFVLLGFRVRYRSCSTQLYFGQNISYNKKNNFIKTRFPSQLRMISVRVHAELHFPDISTVSSARLLLSAYVFSVDTGSSTVFFWLPFREYLYLST